MEKRELAGASFHQRMEKGDLSAELDSSRGLWQRGWPFFFYAQARQETPLEIGFLSSNRPF
jgi:hypothetical protein